MLSVLLASSLSALPPPRPLRPPLAMFSTSIIQDGPSSIAQDGDSLIPYGAEQCAARSISVLHAMSGALSMLERTLSWFAENPGLEARLFGKAGTIAEVMKHVSSGAMTRQGTCASPALADGWRWSLESTPRLCELKAGESSTQRWFLAGGKPAAAVHVTRSPDPCQSRVSIAMFDARGKVRVLLHADFAGAMSAVLLGQGTCRLELTYDPAIEAFKPTWKSCKG